jgi:hypothetical protein
MSGLTGLTSLGGYFPEHVLSGDTGAAALESQGMPLSPQQLDLRARNRAILPGYSQDEYPAPYEFGPGTDRGDLLSGLNPDRTPRTHAAPYAGWVGDYNDGEQMAQLQENLAEVHSEDFGALHNRTRLAGVAEPKIEIWSSNDPGESNLAPVTGQMRNMGGYDTTQGYDLRNRYGFDAGHRKRTTFTDPQPTYSLQPAERPFVVPQAGRNARFTDTVQGPQPAGYSWGYGDAAIPYTDPSAYAPPAEPSTFSGTYNEGPVL